jgi:hypothetical protein
MTSEKWFDWDTSDSPAAGASAPAASTETPAPPVDGARPESTPAQEPSPADFAPFESLDSPDAIGTGTPSSTVSALPSEADAGFAAGALASDDSLPVATEEQAEPRTATALRALNVRPEPPSVADAVRPFHLWITGKLRNFEKERLTELLAREHFGIREVDLELQLEAGKILLPRISEYAAVLMAQALRGTSVELRLEPSELAGSMQEKEMGPPSSNPSRVTSEPLHPADELPVTADTSLPGCEKHEALDILIATGLIREPEWRAETSDAYSEMVESLKRELRFKAHLKKADALVKFEAKVLANPWISDSECRIQVSALAIRFQ